MDISVVVPTYQRPSLLLRCLRALETQSLSKDLFEVVIVSDGPDEITEAAFKSFMILSPLRAKLLSLQTKKGPAAARNLGWRSATTFLVAFTDDDCIPDEHWLHHLLIAAHRHEAFSSFALSGATVVPLPNIPSDYERNISHLEEAEFITANCCCSKMALERVHGFDENFALAWREDSDLHFKFLTMNIPIEKVNLAVVVHPVRKASWGVCIKEEKKGIYNALLYKKFPTLFKSKIQSSPPWRYYVMTLVLLLSIILAIVNRFDHTSLLLFILWVVLTLALALKRLRNTAHTATHIAEMIVTSAVIPFVSLYWRWYGAWKFRALFP